VKFLKFDSSSFSGFLCGIKNDALGPDDGNRLIDLLVFLNPKITSIASPSIPISDLIPKAVPQKISSSFNHLGSHFGKENLLLKTTSKANPLVLFWVKFFKSDSSSF